jgi:hypothetical protein
MATDEKFLRVPMDEVTRARVLKVLRSLGSDAGGIYAIPRGVEIRFIGPEDAALERLAGTGRFWREVR